MLITRTSLATGIERTIDFPVTKEQMDRFCFGDELIQNIFPELDADQREFILTGITPDEWETLFGNDPYEE